MTEPRCPTCGSKCIKVYDTTRPDLFRFIALLQLKPDLIKLMEVWREWGLSKELNVDLFIVGDKEMDRRMRKAVLQAIKGLLEEKSEQVFFHSC